MEDDLDEVYDGVVRYARDAFEALRLMDSLVAIARGANSNDVDLPPLKKRRHNVVTVTQTAEEDLPERSTIAADNPIPTPPFWGTRVVKGIHLADYAAMLDERATFMGQWGLKPTRSGDGPSYEELVEHEGRPRLRAWLDRIATQDIFDPTVLYGYFPVYAEGNDVVLLHHEGPDGGSEGEPLTERMRFTFPRQRRDRHLCLADFVQSRERFFETGTPDVVAVQLVTIGDKVSEHTARMYADNQYRDYLELHGLSVQMTEALAEFWHSRVREELGFADEEPDTTDGLFSLEYRGARFSLGYPACPDMEDRRKIVRLLRARDYGVELSDELQLHPEQSTDAFVFHHPEAKYFSV